MLLVSQQVKVGAVAVGTAMFVLEHDSFAARPRHVHEGRAILQLLDGGPSFIAGDLEVDERRGEHAIFRGLLVRASGLHDDVAQGPLLCLQRPVAAVAGVQANDETIAGPERNATLHINVSEAVSSELAVRTNLPQINHVLKCHMGLFVAGPVAAI